MFALTRASIAISAAVSLPACAIMPDLPPDWALPQTEILLHTACELQGALRGLASRTTSDEFDVTGWSIRVALNPKVDADIQPGAGLMRKQPFVSGALRFATLVIGSGNGITLDMKGQRTGSVDFVFDSAKLITNDRLPCDLATPSYHSLTKNLGIKNWLYRSAEAMIVTGSSIDKPTFSSDVLIKFNGTGSYTYTFPPGTDLVTLSGYYQLQETLNITFTAKAKPPHKFEIVTLPKGGKGFDPNSAPHLVLSQAAVAAAETRGDLAQIELAIRNLSLRAATQ
jgi:hypothetical protein